jgi:type II secretory pathway pseudopilin PulG
MGADRAALGHRSPRRRSGFALFAIVIGIVVITILATLIMAPVSGDNREDRIQRAADVLHRFVAEMDSAAGNTVNYFRGHMVASGGPPNTRQKWPGRLSHLYTQPLSTDMACSGSSYNTENVDEAQWRGPYHLVPIRTTGHNVAPGFFADDALVRVSNTEAYIQIQNVDLDDARSLDLIVDQAANAAAGVVRYAPTNATPVIVQYRFISVGHNPCG